MDPLVEPTWLELPSDALILNCDVEGFVALRAAGKLGVAERRSDSVEICFIFFPRCHGIILMDVTAWRNAPHGVSRLPATKTLGLVVTEESRFDECFLRDVSVVRVVDADVFGYRVTNRLAWVA